MAGPLTIPIIAAGSSLLGQGISAASQGSVNKKTRKWNEKMHALQRSESLSDFALQNSYNHPSSQMARLREAGLNPNLVYGEGAVANNAGGVRPAPVESWSPRAPTVDLGAAVGQGIGAYNDLQVKNAQVDNMRVQNDILQQEVNLKKAQIIATMLGTGKTSVEIKRMEFDLGLSQDLRDTTIEGKKLDVQRTAAETYVLLNRDEREAASNSSNLREAVERILSLRKGRAKSDAEINEINARIKNLDSDQELKQLSIDLQKQGISPNAPTFIRLAAKLAEKMPGINQPGAVSPQDVKNLIDRLKKKR